MVSHRLILGLCTSTMLILLYYCTIIDFHILPVIYIDRSTGESIALVLPAEFRRNARKSEERIQRAETIPPPDTVPYDSIFIYRAYYDDRASNGTVRVLLMSKCIKSPDFFQMKVGSESPQLMSQRPVEGSKCPWAWAPGCKWNAYSLESMPLRENPRRVTIIVNGTREVEVDVRQVERVKKDTLQVCVPPLFWYTDWPRLVLFFEMWRKHNPTFIIYANSISSKVMRVLEYYQNQNIVQIVNWPMLPLAENGEDPNLSIYRLSHSLAHNDCVMRMDSEFGALVDIDEYIHIRNGQNLIDFAREQLKIKENLGSWGFGHNALLIKPLDETFEGIHNASEVKMSGPPKTFFRPDKVIFLSTHQVNRHVRGTRNRMVNRMEAVLMHNRVTFGGKKPGDSVDLGQETPFTSSLFNSSLSVSHQVFGDTLPHFENLAATAIKTCLGRWRSHGCKVPLIHCRESMLPIDDWMFMNETTDSHYTRV